MTNDTGSDGDPMQALAELALTVKTAYANDDAELYASTLDPDAIVSMPGSEPVIGRDALKEAFKSRPPLPPGATFDVDPTELKVISAEWAYAFGTDTLTIPTGEAAPIVKTMTFMVLIRKTAEGWKTFREILSSNQAP